MDIGKCTHFRCESCERIRKIEEQRIVRVAYNAGGRDSQDKFTWNPFFCQICKKCDEEDK